MADAFRSVAGPGDDAFEVRGSRFIGLVRPVDSVDAAEGFVADVAADYDDATHVVPAYRVRVDAESAGGHLLREYQDDDGEPTGSAGKPALNVLIQRDLENVVAAVVRYYGGTNLGVGGLARSYARAVSAAIDAAGLTEREPHETLTITVAYDDSGTVRGLLESTGLEFDASYDSEVSFDVRVPTADVAAIRDRIASATSGRAEVS